MHVQTPTFIFQVKQASFKNSFYLLAAVYFLFFIGFNSIIPELPSYLRQLGGGKYLGLIIGLFALSAMITRPLSGKLADNIGRKPIMIIGSIVGVTVLALYPLFQTVLGFLLLRFFHGFSAGFLPTAAATSVSDIVPSNQMAKYMGYIGVFSSAGIALGPVFGSWFAQSYSMEALFLICSGISMVCLLIILTTKESLPNPVPLSSDLFKLGRKDFFDKDVIGPALIMVLTIYSFGVILTIIPDLSDALGISNRGAFFFCFTLSSVLVRVFFSSVLDRFKREQVLMLGCFIHAAALLGLAFVSSEWAFYAMALILGFSGGINSPVLFAWTVDLASPQNKSRAISTLFISLEFGILAGSAFSGFVFDLEKQNFSLVLLSAVTLSFMAFLILLINNQYVTFLTKGSLKTGA